VHLLAGVLELPREFLDGVLETVESGDEVERFLFGFGLLEEGFGIVVLRQEGGGFLLHDLRLAQLFQPLLGIKH
jgi:hypothetical protein